MMKLGRNALCHICHQLHHGCYHGTCTHQAIYDVSNSYDVRNSREEISWRRHVRSEKDSKNDAQFDGRIVSIVGVVLRS